jgi:hypothetical protein
MGGVMRFARPLWTGATTAPASRVAQHTASGAPGRRIIAAAAPAALRAFAPRPYAAAAGPPGNAPTPNAAMQDDFLSGTSAAYLESVEDSFRADPNSVPPSWAAFLRQMDSGVTGAELSEMYSAARGGAAPVAASFAQSGAVSSQTIQESMRLLLLVRAYQVNGHSMSTLDPLNLDVKAVPVELDPALYGFTEQDLDREFFPRDVAHEGLPVRGQPRADAAADFEKAARNVLRQHRVRVHAHPGSRQVQLVARKNRDAKS